MTKQNPNTEPVMLRCGDCGHTASFLRESGYSNVETVYWVACATCKKMTMWRPAIAALNPYKPTGDGLDDPPPQAKQSKASWEEEMKQELMASSELRKYLCALPKAWNNQAERAAQNRRELTMLEIEVLFYFGYSPEYRNTYEPRSPASDEA